MCTAVQKANFTSDFLAIYLCRQFHPKYTRTRARTIPMKLRVAENVGRVHEHPGMLWKLHWRAFARDVMDVVFNWPIALLPRSIRSACIAEIEIVDRDPINSGRLSRVYGTAHRDFLFLENCHLFVFSLQHASPVLPHFSSAFVKTCIGNETHLLSLTSLK